MTPNRDQARSLSEREIRDRLRHHLNALAVEIGPRPALVGQGLLEAERYIRAAFTDAGLAVEDQAYEYFDRRVANLIATPANSGPGPSYLIGAHYDSVPGTPGADDNASAVAVMLTLAERLGRPPVPLRFAAFTLEEPPAFMTRDQGSRVFVRRAKRHGPPVKGAIVLEMVGYTAARQDYPFFLRWAGYPARGDFIGVIANWRSRPLARAVARGLKRNEELPVETLSVPLNGWPLPATRLSDHASFWDAGWPALMITDTAFMRNPHYHRASDRIETLDFDFMTELVKGLEFAVEELARLEELYDRRGKTGKL
jgi:hypothetical protein